CHSIPVPPITTGTTSGSSATMPTCSPASIAGAARRRPARPRGLLRRRMSCLPGREVRLMSALADLLAGGALAASMTAIHHGAARRFRAATLAPMTEQRRLLRWILARHAATEFGRRHGFAGIAEIDDFRSRVPMASYLELKPYIDRQRDTGERCLTRDSPVFYARTSGTTGEPKLLPMTRAGLARLSRIERLAANSQ